MITESTVKNSPKQCHSDGTPILKIGKCTVCAGSNKTPYKEYKLVINLAGYSYSDDLATPINGAEALVSNFLGHVQQPGTPELQVDWRDGGVPTLRRKDWRRLLSDLEQIDGKVLVHCMGGHGRTGTALAILLNLANAVKGDPVKWLREHYCEKVVETEVQIHYLKRNMNIPVTVGPAKLPVVTPIYQRQIGFQGHSYSDWWSRYDQEKKKYSGEVETTEPAGRYEESRLLYQCITCGFTKAAAFMQSQYRNMTGVCYLCYSKSRHTPQIFDTP